MHLEDTLTPFDIGQVDDYATIETPGAQERRIEHIGSVGRRKKDDTLVTLKTVHLDEKLVERLLTLIVAATETRAAVSANRVDFINKQNAWRVFFALIKEVSHSRGTHPDEHLDKVGTAHRKEGDVGLTSDGLGKKGLPRSRGAQKQRTLGDPAAQLLKPLGILQKLDDLLKLLLGLIRPGDIVKCHPRTIASKHACTALPKAKRLVSTGLHLSHDQKPQTHYQ